MKNLFDRFKTREPKYDEQFRAPLFDTLTKKFGGSESSRADYGKHFSNNYELYIYAFFLGLYNKEFQPIPSTSNKVDFSFAIQNWGSKGTRIGRKDFTAIQEYIFSALVAESDVDLIGLEKGDLSEDDIVKGLIYTMESYTNGGLILIKQKIEENPSYFLMPTSFLNLINPSEEAALV
jgi:hypothetical protein